LILRHNNVCRILRVVLGGPNLCEVGIDQLGRFGLIHRADGSGEGHRREHRCEHDELRS